ncbi:MAG: hypothetical protein RLZZ618_2052 [Pseudomonadota bacterium]|jgi:hypothetical protein
MSIRTLLLLTALAGASLAHSQGVYKWTDEKGRVHYGSVPPSNTAAPPKAVDLKTTQPTAVDRIEAEERNRRNQELIRQSQGTQGAQGTQGTRPTAVTTAGNIPSSKPNPRLSADQTRCQQAWKEYQDADRCFAVHRDKNWNMRPEAYRRCKEVPRPAEACR